MSTEPAMMPPLDAVPTELKQLKLWTPCYLPSTGQNPKRPIVAPKHYNEAYSFEQLQQQLKPGQLCGLLVSPDNEYVVVDIDQTEIPEHISTFLSTYPTYIEYSPSGNKYHIFYKVPKDQFAKAQVKNTNGFVGEVFVRDQFVTVTGQPHSLASNNKAIHSLTYDEFSSVYLSPSNLIDLATKEPTSQPNVEHLAALKVNFSIFQIKHYLSMIPVKPDMRLKRVYKEMGYTDISDYDHWLTVAMALHDACARLEDPSGPQLFDTWSKKDPEKYEGQESTYAKYFACKPDPVKGITANTLFRLYRGISIEWPEPIIDKDGSVLPLPKDTAISNYKAVFEFFNLRFKLNCITKAVTLTGDADIVQKYFGIEETHEFKSLANRCWQFFQDHGFKKVSAIQVKSITELLMELYLDEYNPIRDWITSKPWDGTPRINDLLDTLTFDDCIEPHEIQLYRSLIKKNLMGVIRNNFYTGNYGGTSGIVILQGRENTYKSTWLKFLLPKDLRMRYIGESQMQLSGQSAIKELQLEASLFQMVIYDEVERLMQGKNSSILKNLLTQEMDMYRPLYGKVPIKTPRRAIFWGSTNEVSLQMSNTGNRRIAVIPVQRCDTSALESMDLQQIYAELYHEFKSTPEHRQRQLWQLLDSEIVTLDALNNEHKAESSLDIVIQEMFDFSHPFNIAEFAGPSKRGVQRDNHPRVFRTKAITEMINIETDLRVNHAHVKQVLHRLLGAWTQTNHKSLQVTRTGIVRNGEYVESIHKLWLMPPKKTPFTPEES